MIKYFLKYPRIAFGSTVMIMIFSVALLSLFFTPYNPESIQISARLQKPSISHPFGTDQYGRDILSRVMSGSIVSIMVGTIAVGIGIFFGLSLGSLAAFNGGWTDELIMRVMDILYGFPPLLSAILITSIYGGGAVNSMIAIGVFNIPVFSRLCRSSILSIKEESYIEAAESLGQQRWRVLIFHVLPNAFPPLLVQVTIQFASAILAEAALSYLGLGVQPPRSSWGVMLKQAQNFMTISPWPAIFPGISIVVSVLALNSLGDGLRDLLDPKLAKGL